MRGRGEGDRNLRRANTEPTCSPPVLRLRMRKHVGKKVGGEEQGILSSSTQFFDLTDKTISPILSSDSITSKYSPTLISSFCVTR